MRLGGVEELEEVGEEDEVEEDEEAHEVEVDLVEGVEVSPEEADSEEDEVAADTKETNYHVISILSYCQRLVHIERISFRRH